MIPYVNALPALVSQLALAIGLLAAGVGLYMVLTPYHEGKLIAAGNLSAAIVLSGAVIGLALPIGASLQYGLHSLDILVYGVLAIAVQVLGYRLLSWFAGKTRERVESDDRAPALVVAAGQISLGLLNAAALSTP